MHYRDSLRPGQVGRLEQDARGLARFANNGHSQPAPPRGLVAAYDGCQLGRLPLLASRIAQLMFASSFSLSIGDRSPGVASALSAARNRVTGVIIYMHLRGFGRVSRVFLLASIGLTGCAQEEELKLDPGVSPFYPGVSATEGASTKTDTARDQLRPVRRVPNQE